MKVKISYQTLLLPPPFAFGHTLDLVFENDELHIVYELEYLNRDTINKEEIESEGYSLDDDFKWEGTLGKVWSDEFLPLLENIELQPNNNNENIWMHFKISEGDLEKSGLVKDVELWDFKTQELIQAIYEKAKIELPLEMTFVQKSGESSTKYIVKGAFENRESSVNGKQVSWKEMQDVAETIFSMEFDDEPVKKPNSDGLWIDLSGEGDLCQVKGNRALNNKILGLLTQS